MFEPPNCPLPDLASIFANLPDPAWRGQRDSALFLDVRGRTIFGRNLRHYRKQAGLSQESLAALIGTDPSRISDYERGVIGCSIDAVDRLADALGLPMTALVDEATNAADTKKSPRRSEPAKAKKRSGS